MADISMEVAEFPGELNVGHLEQFNESGYLAFEGVLNEDEIEEARSALTEISIRLMDRARRGEAAAANQVTGAPSSIARSGCGA